MTPAQAIAIAAKGRTPAPALIEVVVRTCVNAFTAALYTQRRRKTIAALQALDDRTLRDIGLSRSSIIPAAEAAVRNPTKWSRH